LGLGTLPHGARRASIKTSAFHWPISGLRLLVGSGCTESASELPLDADLHLWNTIGALLNTFTPTECQNYFTAAGYDAD
jgi:hypothetical protein